jgi:glutaredoxin-related protein
MSRSILAESQLHPAIRGVVDNVHADIIGEVRQAVASDAIVVVGMGWNPFCGKARKQLDALGAAYRYLEYGNYVSQWRRRSGLKMWTGWPTFPMVFVRGTLIGGASELEKLIASGEFATLQTEK